MNVSCPNPGRLKELLDSSLPEEEQASLIGHLDSCNSCQHSLEELAGAPSSLEAVRHMDQDRPPATSAYWAVLRRVENDAPTRGEASPADRPTEEEIDLNFLSPPENPGTLGRLGHFDVVGVIGQGGMGLVLKAFDGCLQRHVALKVLDPKTATNETARMRFCREARSAAAITHENVVAIHQVEREESNDLPFLVMQLITGQSLQDRLDRGVPLELKDVLRIGMQTAAGLAAAHAQSLVHRDIKPANILLEDGSGNVKLTDFGLARAVEDVKLTQTGLVVGTPLYMAPEQAKGEPVDHRTDLFSLGSVLYALCTGKPPFEGGTPFVVLRQVTEELPRPIREINPDIPDWLVEIIDRLHAKDPQDRYQSAAEVADLLGQNLALVQQAAPGAHVSGFSHPPCPGKRWARWKLLAVVVLVALGGLALGLALGVRGKPESGPPPRLTLPRDGDSGPIWSVAFAPEGGLLAAAGDDGVVKIWDLQTGKLRTALNAHQGPIWAVRLAPGGVMATVSDDGTAKVWDALHGKIRRALRQPISIRAVALSRDGRTLATGGRDGSLRIWDLRSDQNPLTPAGHEGVIMSMAFARDGKLLATGSGFDRTVKLWDVATGQLQLTLKGHEGGVYAVALSPDGKYVASGGYGKSVALWDAANGTKLATLNGHERDVWSLAFSPDGGRLASGSEDRTVKVWDVVTGKLVVTFREHGGPVYAVAFSPDGKTVASGGRDGTVKLWDVPALKN